MITYFNPENNFFRPRELKKRMLHGYILSRSKPFTLLYIVYLLGVGTRIMDGKTPL